MKRISLCLCTLLVSLSAFSQGIQDYCTLDSLKYKGDMRHYWIHVPEKLSDAAPLMVWLYEVQGGTHSWSDKEMDTYAQIWSFMSRFMY